MRASSALVLSFFPILDTVLLLRCACRASRMNQMFSHHMYSPCSSPFSYTQELSLMKSFRTRSKIDPRLTFGRPFHASKTTWWYDSHSSFAYSLRLRHGHDAIGRSHVGSHNCNRGLLYQGFLTTRVWLTACRPTRHIASDARICTRSLPGNPSAQVSHAVTDSVVLPSDAIMKLGLPIACADTGRIHRSCM